MESEVIGNIVEKTSKKDKIKKFFKDNAEAIIAVALVAGAIVTAFAKGYGSGYGDGYDDGYDDGYGDGSWDPW